MTDIGFYELRYSGQPAAFLRGFRAVYLGVFFNVMIMATRDAGRRSRSAACCSASPPLATVRSPAESRRSSAWSGGLTGVLLTDLLLFVVAMAGSVAAAYVAVNHPEVGGLARLLSASARRREALPPARTSRTTAAR